MLTITGSGPINLFSRMLLKWCGESVILVVTCSGRRSRPGLFRVFPDGVQWKGDRLAKAVAGERIRGDQRNATSVVVVV
jgi:hypothetical protein